MSSANDCLRKPPESQALRRPPVTSETDDLAAERVLTVGETVVVFAIGCCGPSIEGHGVIEAHGAAWHQYHIRFVGEPRTRLRFINPDWQEFPERSLALLREFWRSNRIDDPLIEDFFPDDSP